MSSFICGKAIKRPGFKRQKREHGNGCARRPGNDQENEPGNFFRGGYIERELVYEGKDLKEIAAQIQRDENALLEYMRTGQENGEKCFVFQGFMFRKGAITAAQLREPEY